MPASLCVKNGILINARLVGVTSEDVQKKSRAHPALPSLKEPRIFAVGTKLPPNAEE